MKLPLPSFLVMLAVALASADEPAPALAPAPAAPPAPASAPATFTITPVPAPDTVDTQPRLLRIKATVDGSGRFVFTRKAITYEHKHWEKPANVEFDGTLWTDLASFPAAWLEIVAPLDLSRAYIDKRAGRDTIALEHTAEGFDLYLCDAPDGGEAYEVTIAIPKK